MSFNYKLGRIHVDAWTNLHKIKKSEDKYVLDRIDRAYMFTRLYSRDNDQECERLMIPYYNDYYVQQTKEYGKAVYAMDNEGNFEYKIPWDTWNGSDLEKKFLEDERKSVTIQKLSGKALTTLADDEFVNGNNLDIVVKRTEETAEQGVPNEYICSKHLEFIRPVFKILLPKAVGDNIELVELGHGDTMYRKTKDSANTYLSIPRDFPYILEHTDKDEASDYKKAWLYLNGEKINEADTLEVLLKNADGRIHELVGNSSVAIENLIPMKDCDIYLTSAEISE